MEAEREEFAKQNAELEAAKEQSEAAFSDQVRVGWTTVRHPSQLSTMQSQLDAERQRLKELQTEYEKKAAEEASRLAVFMKQLGNG